MTICSLSGFPTLLTATQKWPYEKWWFRRKPILDRVCDLPTSISLSLSLSLSFSLSSRYIYIHIYINIEREREREKERARERERDLHVSRILIMKLIVKHYIYIYIIFSLLTIPNRQHFSRPNFAHSASNNEHALCALCLLAGMTSIFEIQILIWLLTDFPVVYYSPSFFPACFSFFPDAALHSLRKAPISSFDAVFQSKQSPSIF